MSRRLPTLVFAAALVLSPVSRATEPSPRNEGPWNLTWLAALPMALTGTPFSGLSWLWDASGSGLDPWGVPSPPPATSGGAEASLPESGGVTADVRARS